MSTRFDRLLTYAVSAPTVSTPQTMARPRLVAKSGSGLRDSPRPRTGAEGPTETATVWNKNRRM